MGLLYYLEKGKTKETCAENTSKKNEHKSESPLKILTLLCLE